jgi:diacylglycerol O-acyltransferase / wax synthase
VRTRLSSIDWAFLQAESPSNLAHVAGLWIFELPKGYRANFWQDFLRGLDDSCLVTPPFNYRVSSGLELPAWVEDADIDLDNHVRFSALPKPGTTGQLMQLMSRLHSRQLDRSRPLWECYLIEGLKGRRVAMYLKVHHAMFDGSSAMEYLTRALSESPAERARRAVWQPGWKWREDAEPGGLLQSVGKASGELFDQVRSLPELSSLLARQGLEALNLVKSKGEVMFSAPRTRLGRAITPDRRLGVKTFSLSRIKELGRRTDATVNDVVLAMCAGALRDYFLQIDELPRKPLTAWVPVSLRTSGKQQGGNQVAVMVCSLATDMGDAGQRLDAIKSSIQDAKHRLKGQSRKTIETHTQLMSGAIVALQKLGIADRVAPAANVVISNVPGPREPKYLNGAMLVEQFPVSMILDGQALNITALSHDDRLDFGLLACPVAVPHPQHLADLLETALQSLEST